RNGRLEMTIQAHREGELTGLEVEQAKGRVGVQPDDGVRVRGGHLLDLDPTLCGAHEQDPALRPIEDRREVELLDDVRGRADQYLADGHALDVHAEDAPGHRLGFIRGACELDAARLPAAADKDLRLDHDLAPDAAGPGLCREEA